jgi:murein DD-endopeptidase MepM/ murein hydrolase activator NlpD
MDVFPLPPSSSYSYARRFNSEHRGTDIMAPLGTPVLAVEGGAVWSDIEPKGGKVAYLLGDSGTTYFYGHLSEWALKVISATKEQPYMVHAGTEIGKVGNTGNAAGGPPHVHFQMRHGVSFPSDPFDALLEADDNKRGKGGGGGGGAVFALALLWFLSRRSGRA